ncbi:hypothetical protein D3C72_859670 [compost metagenome]
MRFHRSKRQINGGRDFGVGQARPVTQGDAQPFRLGQALHRLVQIHAPGAIDIGRDLIVLDLGDIAGVLRAALQIDASRDPLDPGAEGPLPPKLGALLERQQKGVLGHIVGQSGLRPHPTQQTAHRRAVATHQFPELATSARRRQGGELDIVQIA